MRTGSACLTIVCIAVLDRSELLTMSMPGMGRGFGRGGGGPGGNEPDGD